MLDGTAGQSISSGSAELVSRITADVLPLMRGIEKLDREFESADSETPILNAIRVAVQECRRIAPGHLDRLQQRISIRALLEDIDPKKVRGAMGGLSRHDAYFTRLLAKGFEQSRDSADAFWACRAWNEFRLSAVEEGWFAPNGVEAATLYLHTAKLLDDVPKEMIRSFEKAALLESKQ